MLDCYPNSIVYVYNTGVCTLYMLLWSNQFHITMQYVLILLFCVTQDLSECHSWWTPRSCEHRTPSSILITSIVMPRFYRRLMRCCHIPSTCTVRKHRKNASTHNIYYNLGTNIFSQFLLLPRYMYVIVLLASEKQSHACKNYNELYVCKRSTLKRTVKIF